MNTLDPTAGDGFQPPPLDGAELTGTTPAGAPLSIALDHPGRATVLAFLSTGCGGCSYFWRELASPETDRLLEPTMDLVIVTRGVPREDPEDVRAVAPATRTTLMSSEVWERYGVPWNPYFIVVDGSSLEVVTEGTAQSWGELVGIVTQEVPTEPAPLAQDQLPLSWADPRLRVEPSPAGDHRLVATEAIEAGELVLVWAGVSMSAAEAEAFVERNPAWRALVLDEGTRLLQSDEDPSVAVAHSCDPNAWLDGPFTVVLRQPVETGEPITMDTATWLADPDWHCACICGSPGCRGSLAGSDWRRAELQDALRGHWSPYVAQLIDGAGGDAGSSALV